MKSNHTPESSNRNVAGSVARPALPKTGISHHVASTKKDAKPKVSPRSKVFLAGFHEMLRHGRHCHIKLKRHSIC